MTRFAVLSLLTVMLAAASPAQAQDLEDRIAASRAVVKEFAGALRHELTQALAGGAPSQAISVCRMAAPAIGADQTGRTGWQVGRTSLRVRNPDNAPDAWETATLESFEARKAAGEDVKRLEHSEIVVAEDGQQSFRYMKAIPTGELCLTCHGSDISPDVQATLNELYPDDRATGFAAGDIRGAFTIMQPM